MLLRFLVAIICSIPVVAPNAQVPAEIPTRAGPPLTDGHGWKILSVGGWWIRVNGEGTTTRQIDWQFGKGPEFVWWNVFWLRPLTRDGRIPERLLYPGNIPTSGWIELQPLQVIYVRATTKDETDSASFCVFYQQEAVARIDFVGETLQRLDATQREPRCTP
jgi:hypothetical protein